VTAASLRRRAAKQRRRNEIIRLLVERLGRHRPYLLDAKKTVAVIRRIIRHAADGLGGCIFWSGALNNDGYGKMNLILAGYHRQVYVHWLIELLANNPREFPHWMETSHRCNHPPCLHPDHVGRERKKDNRRRSAERSNLKKRRELARAPEYREAA